MFMIGVSHIEDPNIDEIVNTLESKEINQVLKLIKVATEIFIL